ncbi:General vesicular transport factor p115 [Exaiptasia diaphana]|nr:General vesicular transport factor p115 [Exaiptasia diaphana]
MVNLLRNNVSNQNFFREGSFIQRFTPFFEMSALAMQGENETGWLEQKVSNVQLMLKVVRILVSPDNPQQATTAAQKMMNQSGLLKLLCDILMASGIPADILTEAINTVSEVIRGFPANQDYFSQVNAPSEPPRQTIGDMHYGVIYYNYQNALPTFFLPAIVVLLMSMINDKQPFSLRCAVLYCFQCYLYKNEQGQGQIVSTLLPSSSDVGK